MLTHTPSREPRQDHRAVKWRNTVSKIAISVVMFAVACGVAACSGDSNAMAATKQKLTPAQKIIWTSTAGTVTSGSPASHGQALAARADGLAGSAQTGAISNSIPNLGCPEASVAQGEETPIIQGTATAPSGTTAPWSFKADATGYLASPNDGNNAARNVHIKAYIGTPDSSCVDFPSCKSQLPPLMQPMSLFWPSGLLVPRPFRLRPALRKRSRTLALPPQLSSSKPQRRMALSVVPAEQFRPLPTPSPSRRPKGDLCWPLAACLL